MKNKVNLKAKMDFKGLPLNIAMTPKKKGKKKDNTHVSKGSY